MSTLDRIISSLEELGAGYKHLADRLNRIPFTNVSNNQMELLSLKAGAITLAWHRLAEGEYAAADQILDEILW